jgi:hypothetical protein
VGFPNITWWPFAGRSGRGDVMYYDQIHECTAPLTDTSAPQYEPADQHSPKSSQKC